MITLIVEDGSIVANANTYVGIVEARSIATDFNLTLPTDDEQLKAALLNAMTYIENFAHKLQGHRANASQFLEFPRNLVSWYDNPLPNDEIPKNVKIAQVSAACMVGIGVNLFPTIEAGLITEETIGPITTKYAYPNAGREQFDSVDVFMKPFLVVENGYRLSGCGF